MNSIVKSTTAVFLNITLLANQLLADLPPITFDSSEWIPFETVGQNPATGWQLFSGNASVSADGEGVNGGRALKIPANSQTETKISRAIPWTSTEDTAFIDMKVKPAEDPVGSLASIFVNGTQIAFQVPQGSTTGEIWVYQGNDGAANPATDTEEWIKTVGTFPVPSGGTAAANFLRITFRHDYQRNLWDLFIDGKLAAANLSFDERDSNLQNIDFYGSMIGDTLADDLAALTTNMLFPDADKDGLSDAWEIANGSNPNLYDRDAIKSGYRDSFLDRYMKSLWPTGGANGAGTLPSSGGIPPLTIDAEAPHQPVGALKGSLSVGGDGSANYSVPIDIPKGTAGMEPKLSLGYSSGGGNGLFGVGWNLAGLQRITRGSASAAKDGAYDPIDFDGSDRFFLDGERLVCVAGTYGAPGSEYRTEIDSYARITAIGSGPTSWKIETKAGLIVILEEPAAVTGGILSWGVTRVQDTVGNYYTVDYTRESTTNLPFNFIDHRVSAVHYTGNSGVSPYCHVYFDYETRPDISSAYTTHAGYQITKRLSTIRVMTQDRENHFYRLNYSTSYQTGRSMLTSIEKYAKYAQSTYTSVMIPPTTFNYDGIRAGEAIWRDPGTSSLPIYGVNLDANGGGVNSFVNTSSSDNTLVELTGDVSRCFQLPTGSITLYPDTCIQFDFKSDNQTTGAIIGLDSNADYSASSIQKLCRIGGTGSLVLNSSGQTYSGVTQPYSVGQGWATYSVPIGASGSPVMSNLVLMCVDNNAADGIENASFRNIRIYRSGTQQPTDLEPIRFPQTFNLPVLFDSDGKDKGVVSLDLNADGLPDIADWRVIEYSTTNNLTTAITKGDTYRNTGSGFVVDNSLRPPSSLPLGVLPKNIYTDLVANKHRLLGRPVDINGDGILDLLASVNIRSLPDKVITNEYTFHTWNGSVWAPMSAAYDLPFRIHNTPSNTSNGGKYRTEHFEWVDLNSDGYQDLVIYTTPDGRLYDKTTNALIAGGNSSLAYINKGKDGPGWIRDDSYRLPEPLSVNQSHKGRHLVDLDGDGVVELAESTGTETSVISHIYRMDATGSYRWNSTPGLMNPPGDPYNLPVSFRRFNNPDPGLILADFNGDSLPDILQARYENYNQIHSFHLNTGYSGNRSWSPTTSFQWNSINYRIDSNPLSYVENGYVYSYGFEMSDLNGDGLLDILKSDIDIESTLNSDPMNCVFLNTGLRLQQRSDWGMPGTHRFFTSTSNRNEGKRSARLQDINGDGFPDLLTGLLGTTPQVWYNQCRPEVLKSVTDGFGSQLLVDYKRLNDPTPTEGFGSRVYQKWTDTMLPGHNAVIDARLVVSSYSEPDGNGGRRVRSQRYGDLRYDRFNESSLGFGWIEAKDHLNNQTTRTETSRVYPFGGSPVWTRTWVEVKSSDLHPALVGVTAGTKCLSEETATYAEMTPQVGIAGGTIRRPVQIGSVKTLCDLNANTLSRTTTAQNLANFDAYGFVKNSSVTALDGSVVSTANTYTHTVDPTRWFLGRLSQSTVTKSGAGKPSLTKTSAFTYVSTNGLLKSETIEPSSTLSSTKTYTYDRFGNVISTSVTCSGLTRSSSAIHDSSGRFLQSETNQLGQTVYYHHDFNRALLLGINDINGQYTSFSYDTCGTLIRTWHPDDGTGDHSVRAQTGETTGFSSNAQLPAAVAAEVTHPILYFRAKQSSGSPVGKVYLDALGREIVAETTILRTASGAVRYSKVYTVSRYDALGRKIRISEPFGPGDNPNFTAISYDLLGRVVNTTHPDGQSDVVQEFNTATIASQLTTYSKVRNAKNGVLERWEDQHGRLIQSRDPSAQITTFNHDQEGRVVSVAINNTTLLTNTFDLFGNKTSVNEANSGTSTSTFNALGEVTSSTNAKGQTTSFACDVLGRVVTVTKPEGTYTTSYDGAGGAGIGKPWKTTGPDGYEEIVSYDSLGRPRTSTKTQFGETHSSVTSYDALGRVITSTDAGGLTVVNEYDPKYSFPISMRIGPGVEGAGTLLWHAGSFDSRGRALTQTLAQGVTASATYHATTGLLTSLNSCQGGTSLQSKTYAWDTMGNLASRSDAIAARNETFSYDSLNRVTGSTVAALSGSTISSIPPPASYTYDIKGNLLSKPGAVLTYGGSRPHAVTEATVKDATRTYSYDAAGYVAADGKRTYTWTSFGQLSSLDYLSAPALQNFAGITVYQASRVQSDFSFDAGGNRARQIKQRIAANDSRQLEETLYLGSYEREIHMTKASAAASPVVTKTVHRHNLGGFAVYTKTAKPGMPDAVKLSTILKDHLGSTDLILTSTWSGSTFANPQSERQSFNPWGERRAADTLVTYRATDSDPFRTSAQDYDRGYTGHEQLDDSGLIHMNGRIYDPELGRMLSPDPVVQVPEYSQNFNRYSYVMNNPMNMTDPSGFSWLGNVFHKMGSWLKENWKTVVVIVVAVVLYCTGFGSGVATALLGTLSTATAVTVAGAAVTYGSIVGAAAIGFVSGGLSAALAGGDLGDVLRGAAVGAVQGAITAGFGNGVEGSFASGNYGAAAAYTAGHGIVGGASNEAMGGKFQDGFLSAAASSAAQIVPYGNKSVTGGLLKSTAVGGTANVIGGGKFTNGAATSAFHYMISSAAMHAQTDQNILDGAENGNSREVYFGGSKDSPGHFWAAITQENGTIMKYDFGAAGFGGLAPGISGKVQALFKTLWTGGKVEYRVVSSESWATTLKDSKLKIYKYNIDENLATRAGSEFSRQVSNPPSYMLLNENCSHRSLSAFGIIGSPSPLPAKQIDYIGQFHRN